MISFTRSFPQLAGLRSAATRRLALSLCATTALSLFALTASAGAKVVSVPTGSGSEKVAVGLQPREAESIFEGFQSVETPVESFNNPEGNPVLHKNETYAIYWDPTDHYHGDWQNAIDTFFHGLGADSGSVDTVFAVDSQYTDKSDLPASYASTFRGAYTDTDPYPAGDCKDPHPLAALDRIGPEVVEGSKKVHTEVCLTDGQIRKELQTFIAAHGLQKGIGSIFYLLTPAGVTVCLDKGGSEGHCSDFNGTTTEVLNYENAVDSYPERLAAYEKERKTYEKEQAKYEKADTKYMAEVEKYNKQKEKDELAGEPDVEAEPVEPTEPIKPVKPVVPAPPPGYSDYKNSFCSYHSDFSDVTLENATTPEASTILYGVIPWTAGGLGDGHLVAADQTPAYACQDGGFAYNPQTFGYEKEKAKEPKIESAKEKEEHPKNAEEERKQAEAEEKALILEGPHQEEPNQLGSSFGPDGSFDHGLADLIVSQIGVQQQDIVTDPLLNAWHDSAGNEVTDECRNNFALYLGGSAGANERTFAGTLSNQSFGGVSAYINDTFNIAAGRLPYPGVPCLNGIDLVPQFTAPNTVYTNELVSFDGMESDITLNDDIGYSKTTGAEEPEYATYKWNFGDGTPVVTGLAPGAPSLNSPETSPCELPWKAPCAASTFHSYQNPGTYNVTLTATDTGGNEATVIQPITVCSPAPAICPPPPAGTTTTTTIGGTTTTRATTPAGTTTPAVATPPAKPPLPGPVASAAAVSHSLRSVVKKGLVIGYTVNEQVAGQFQVLLAASIAKRIGLHGAPATGLAVGTPPEIVIAQAVLITTKGGHNTIKIKFGKKTAAKLRKLGTVTLTIRLFVRNASHSPLTTTVLSTVTLTH